MNEPGIDLTGKLIIKVALGDDIRRILITNEDITYDELVLMMQRVYRGKLNSTDDIVIKYKDEDNDLITIFDSSDLSFAIQCSRILKITLFVNSKPEPLQTDEIKMIKTEFKHIRDRCTKILDRLDDREVSDFPSSSADITTSSNKGTIADSPMRAAAPSPRMAPPVNPAGSKEFDPLSTQRSMEDHQEKVMSSFGVTSNDRAGTPDSVSSIGSAGQRPPGQVPSQTGPQGPAQNTPQGPPQHPSHPQQPPQDRAGTPDSVSSIGSAGQRPPGQVPSQTGPQGPAQNTPHGPPQQPSQPQQHPQGTSMYTDPSPQKMPPWQQAQQNQQQNASGQPPHFPGQQQQQQQPGYPQTSQQQGYPGQQPPTSQPQGVPQGVPNSTTGPSYGPRGFGQYGGQPQHGQFPGQQPGQPGPQGQMGHPSQQQQQQQQQPQQPGSPFYPQNPGQQPGNPRQPGPPGPGGNPYARQAHGYGSGYPRPAASYPQGYQ